MKKILEFLSENFQFLVVKFSVYLNRHAFVMVCLVRATPIVVQWGSYKRQQSTQQAIQRLFNINKLNQRCLNVVSTLCARWVYFSSVP